MCLFNVWKSTNVGHVIGIPEIVQNIELTLSDIVHDKTIRTNTLVKCLFKQFKYSV
jgi:hypothetical protein